MAYSPNARKFCDDQSLVIPESEIEFHVNLIAIAFDKTIRSHKLLGTVMCMPELWVDVDGVKVSQGKGIGDWYGVIRLTNYPDLYLFQKGSEGLKVITESELPCKPLAVAEFEVVY
jgi:hypothetical protein